MYQGGVGILVREEMQRHIKQIELLGRRILKIIPTSQNADDPITILSTYAPHMGYTLAEKKQHWDLSQETIKQIHTTNHCVWWADANGQLRNRDRTDPTINKIIGMNALGRTTEPRYGKNLRNICAHRDLVPMSAWRRQPRQTKHGPEDISTWAHPCGTIKDK